MPRKRAPNGNGTVRQRKDGRWEAIYSVGRDPGTGRLIRKSVYGDNEQEVAKALRKATAAIDENTYVEPSKLPLSKWLDIWLAEYTGNVKEHTRASYDTQCRIHIKPALGAVMLSELRPHEIQAFYNRLARGTRKPTSGAKGKKSAQGLSPKTIKNIHGVLHRALDQAVMLGYLKQHPCVGVMLPRVERADIKPLMDEQIDTFLGAIEGNEYEQLFTITMYTGMRQAEAMGLQWSCVDFKGGTIYIDKQLLHEKKKDGVYKFAPPKNDKPRRITPAPSVMKMLEAVRLRQKEDKLKAGAAWQNEMDLVFTDALGGHYAHATVYHTFKRIAAAIGLPDRRFHDLRHTYAVLAIQSGVDIKTVQENLGHHTAAFTLDQYGHVTQRMQNEAAARMEAVIAARKGKKPS